MVENRQLRGDSTFFYQSRNNHPQLRLSFASSISVPDILGRRWRLVPWKRLRREGCWRTVWSKTIPIYRTYIKNPIRVLTILFVAYLGHMRSTIWHRGSTFCPTIVLSALGDRLFNRGTNRHQPLDRFFVQYQPLYFSLQIYHSDPKYKDRLYIHNYQNDHYVSFGTYLPRRWDWLLIALTSHKCAFAVKASFWVTYRAPRVSGKELQKSPGAPLRLWYRSICRHNIIRVFAIYQILLGWIGLET